LSRQHKGILGKRILAYSMTKHNEYIMPDYTISNPMHWFKPHSYSACCCSARPSNRIPHSYSACCCSARPSNRIVQLDRAKRNRLHCSRRNWRSIPSMQSQHHSEELSLDPVCPDSCIHPRMRMQPRNKRERQSYGIGVMH
jgi:hypothetical protein